MIPKLRRRDFVVLISTAAVAGGALLLTADLSFDAIRHGGKAAVSSVTAATHDSFDVSAPIVLSRVPLVVLNRGTVSVARANGDGPRGTAALFAALARADADLTLENGELLIKEAAEATSGANPGSMTEERAPVLTALGSLKFKSLTLKNTTVVAEGAGGGVARFTVTAADLSRKSPESLSAKGEAMLRGEAFEFESTLGLAESAKDAGLPLTLTASSRVLEIATEARVHVGKRFQLFADQAEVSSNEVGALMRLASIAWPQGTGIKTFSATGPMSWSGGVAGLENARCEIDGNEATGNLSIDTGGERPAIEATLAFEDLKLDPYITGDGKESIAAGIARALAMVPLTGLVRSSDGIPLEAANADVRISATNVTSNGTVLGEVAAALTLKDGALVADFTEIVLPSGGTGGAQLSTAMKTGEPRYAMRINLDRVALAGLTEQVFGMPLVEGFGALKADLTTDVLSPGNLVHSLNGKITLAAAERVRVAGNLEALLAAASRKPTDGWQIGSGRMQLDDLMARFDLKAGVLSADQVTARSGPMHLMATGTVNLVDRTLDVALSRSPDPALTGAGPQRGDVLELRGAWNHPSIRTASPLPASAVPAP